jgi:hypothetical protein
LVTTGALGDLIERGHGVAVAGEFSEGGFKDLVRALGLAPATGVGPPFDHFSHGRSAASRRRV